MYLQCGKTKMKQMK